MASLIPPPGDDQASCLGYLHGGLRRKDCPPPPTTGPWILSFCLGALSITLGGERKLFQKLSKPRVPVAFWSYLWWGKGKAGTPPSGPGVPASQHYHSVMSPLQFLCRGPDPDPQKEKKGELGEGDYLRTTRDERNRVNRRKKTWTEATTSDTYTINGKGTFLF